MHKPNPISLLCMKSEMYVPVHHSAAAGNANYVALRDLYLSSAISCSYRIFCRYQGTYVMVLFRIAISPLLRDVLQVHGLGQEHKSAVRMYLFAFPSDQVAKSAYRMT